MSTPNLSTADLIRSLAAGSVGAHAGLARELVMRLAKALDASYEIHDDGERVRFDMQLSGVHLCGLEDVPCLLIVGGGEPEENALGTLWRQAANAGRLAIVLALSQTAMNTTRRTVPADRAIVLDAATTLSVAESDEPRGLFLSAARRQICLRQLVPFQILRPVSGNMFFGRREILDRLLHRPMTSYAIAGPSGIGKSSILAQYQDILRRSRDPRVHRLITVNFKSVSDVTGDAVARRIAMAVSPSSRTYYHTLMDDLPRILQQQAVRLDGPLDLLFDEVDEVCQTKVFQILGDAAKLRHCRLVFCGRGVLLRVMTDRDSTLLGRLQLLQPEPLPTEIARELVVRPLQDLGFQIGRDDEFLHKIFRLSGRLPHALQFLLNKVANYCIDHRIETISASEFEAVANDFESAQFFSAPLRNIRDKDCYQLGLMLLTEMKGDFSIADVCRLASDYGMPVSDDRAFEVCSDLLINNVLAWSHSGCFHVANEALVSFVARLGLFSSLNRPVALTGSRGDKTAAAIGARQS